MRAESLQVSTWVSVRTRECGNETMEERDQGHGELMISEAGRCVEHSSVRTP